MIISVNRQQTAWPAGKINRNMVTSFQLPAQSGPLNFVYLRIDYDQSSAAGAEFLRPAHAIKGKSGIFYLWSLFEKDINRIRRSCHE